VAGGCTARREAWQFNQRAIHALPGQRGIGAAIAACSRNRVPIG